MKMKTPTATARAFPESVDVSGMSDVSALFEESVRAMILKGADWIEANPDANPQFGRILGSDPVIMTSVNAAASLLRVEMLKASPRGTTAEMVRVAVNNVRVIRIIGWTRYLQGLKDGVCF